LVNDRSWSIKSSNNIGEVGDNYLENEPNPIKCPFIILDSLKACCLGKPEDKYEREQNAGERDHSFQEITMRVRTNLNSDPKILKMLTIAIMPATITESTLK